MSFRRAFLIFSSFNYSNVPGILPILISSRILFLSVNLLRVFFFLTYSEGFLRLYLLLRRRDKIPEPCTLFVNFLIKPRLLSRSPFDTSTFTAIWEILYHSSVFYAKPL